MSVFLMKPEKRPSKSFHKGDDSGNDEHYTADNAVLRKNEKRPISASASDLKITKGLSSTLYSQPRIKQEKPKPTIDFIALSRPRQRKIVIDKEQLYEENLALKHKCNNLQEELTKSRTKISQIEKDLSKKEELTDYYQSYKPKHLVNSLKETIKSLKIEIQEQNAEILSLKKNIKSTKAVENEMEVQGFADECVRLKEYLEEVIRQKEAPLINQTFLQDQQAFIVNNYKKEIEELNNTISGLREEVNGWKQKIFEAELTRKELKRKKAEISDMKKEMNELKKNREANAKENNHKQRCLLEEIEQQKNLVGEFRTGNIKLENLIKELYEEIKEANRNNERSETEIERLNGEIEEHIQTIKEKERELKYNRNKSDEINSLNEDLKKQLTFKSNEIEYQKKLLTDSQKQLESHNTQKLDLQTQVEKIKLKSESYRTRFNEMNSQLGQFQQKNKEYLSKIEELKKILKAQAKKISKKAFEPPKLFKILNCLAVEKQISFQQLLESLNNTGKRRISLESFFEKLRKLNGSIKGKHIKEIIGFIRTKDRKDIDLNILLKLYDEFSYKEDLQISNSSDSETYSVKEKENSEESLKSQEEEGSDNNEQSFEMDDDIYSELNPKRKISEENNLGKPKILKVFTVLDKVKKQVRKVSEQSSIDLNKLSFEEKNFNE